MSDDVEAIHRVTLEQFHASLAFAAQDAGLPQEDTARLLALGPGQYARGTWMILDGDVDGVDGDCLCPIATAGLVPPPQEWEGGKDEEEVATQEKLLFVVEWDSGWPPGTVVVEVVA